MNTQKSISPLLWVVIVLSLVIVAGGIIAWQMWPKKGAPTPPSTTVPASTTTPSSATTPLPSPPKDETAGWKTYRNENGNYVIKYPSDLIIEHSVVEAGKTSSNLVDSLVINSENNTTYPAEWRIEVRKNTENLSAQQRAEQLGGVTPTQNKVITKVNIDNVEGRKVVMDYLPSDVDPENTVENATSIFVVKGKNIYEFFCVNKITKKSGIKIYDHLRFDQMLSTFKFLKPKDETADWKIYRDEEYGFEFSYPKNWSVIRSEHPGKPYLEFLALGPSKTIQTGSTMAISVDTRSQENYLNSLKQDGWKIVTTQKVSSNYGITGKAYLLEKKAINLERKEILVVKDSLLYVISGNEASSSVMDEIFSTFRFIK